ncbi:cell envelope integrity protein TolA [Methylobacterium indicum]|nr:cell envelope integrity protein TolA [Methylobacterium indicum]KMO22048.1 cell envelope biogenesis protein TolA [Methylobacterium indicum]
MVFPFDRSEPGVWVSAGAHVVLIGLALFAAASHVLPQAEEGVPVEVITENQFSELTKGQRDGDAPAKSPRADRVADKQRENDPGEAKADVPTPPTRPPEMKVANAEEMPTPPLRPALEQPEPAPMPPARPDTAKADAEKAAAAAAAAAAKAKADAEAREAKAEAEREAKEAAKAAAKEAAKEAAKAAAEKAAATAAKAAAEKAAAEKAEAEAIRREELAEAKAAAEKAAADKAAAKAKAEAKARAEADAKAKAEAKAEAEAKAQAEAEAKAKAVADAKAKAEAKARAEAKAEAEAKAQAEAEAKAEAKAEAEAKAHAAAEAKAKAEAAAKAKAVADARAKAAAEAKAKRQAELAAKFNSGSIRDMLASHGPSQSTGATGREVQRTAALGAATGTSQRLNPSQRDALVGLLQQQIERCYSAPPGAAQGIVLPQLDIRLNPDGSLTTDPRILRAGGSAVDRSIAEAAVRAVRRCAPFRIPAQFAPFYNDWRVINAEFELPRA